MPPVWQALSSIFGAVFDRTCVRPLNAAFYDATGRYAVAEAPDRATKTDEELRLIIFSIHE